MPAPHDPWPRSSEFIVQVEMWYSAKNPLLRKNAAPRKKDKRDSIQVVDDSPRKLKERPSWLTIARNVSAGQWRPATCKLSEDADNCVLSIYGEDKTLQHSLYIHLLRSTDIRPTDKSLFFRHDCLGIHVQPGHGMISTTSFLEPIFLAFPSTDALHTWLALLRSYAQPEIYGRRLAPGQQGGLYRMWRQVELVVLQARNLGALRQQQDSPSAAADRSPGPNAGATPAAGAAAGGGGGAGGGGAAANGSDPAPDNDAADLDVFCEMVIEGHVAGRTTVKKGSGAPDWHESFVFSDLPPFGLMLINIWREKKLFKPTFVGTVELALTNFRRGEFVEGWLPVLSMASHGVQVGELRIKAKVDEEIILPSEAYTTVVQTLDSRNYLDLLNELEQKLRLEHIATHMLSLAVSRNMLLEDILELVDREVGNAALAHNTLFRGNSILTKTVEHALGWYGKAFLDASVGPVIRRMCHERVAIEVDPVRSHKGFKDLDHNVRQLTYWCGEFWNQIWHARSECPQEIRKLLHQIRSAVERRFATEANDLRWQSVSAFCFLRFIVPAILHPHLFGLCPGQPTPAVSRSLTLVAKVIQSLANLNTTVHKEEFMRGIKDFMVQNLPAMIDYILFVSTPNPDPFSASYPTQAADRHDRLHVTHSLRERLPDMPALQREAVPLLPHLLDVPKHLAVITSAVVRHARGPKQRSGAMAGLFRPGAGGANAGDEPESRLERFALQCFDVEARALHYVSRLASRPSGGSGAYRTRGSATSVDVRPSAMARPGSAGGPSAAGGGTAVVVTTTTVAASPTNSTASTTSGIPRTRKRTLRPATAPSPTTVTVGSSRIPSNGSVDPQSPPPPQPRESPTSPRAPLPNSPTAATSAAGAGASGGGSGAATPRRPPTAPARSNGYEAEVPASPPLPQQLQHQHSASSSDTSSHYLHQAPRFRRVPSASQDLSSYDAFTTVSVGNPPESKKPRGFLRNLLTRK